MDRSFAGRPSPAGRLPPIGRLLRPLRATPPSRGRRTGGARAGRARSAPGVAWPLGGARRLLGAARTGLAFILRRRRARIALLGALLALALVAGGWLLLRHSSLVAVKRVQITGVRGPEASAIDAALVGAGRHMSTLDVRVGALRSAVAPFRVVREVHASASFPHGLAIRVVEQLPVAALTVGSMRSAVAADGVVLGPGLLSGSLPTLYGSYVPAPGQRLTSATLLAPLTILGAAPAPLARLVARVFSGPKGLTAAMSNGLQAYFGDASRPHAKWLSLARVLADPSSAGAANVDVRLPERPAAGFPPGVTPPARLAASGSAQTAEPSTTSEPTVEALAAGLARNTPAAGSTPGEAASAPPSGSGAATGTESTTPPPIEGGGARGEGSEASSETGG
jgi:cell division protein FtsQ